MCFHLTMRFRVTAALAFVGISAAITMAQPSREAFRRLLAEKAAFTEAEFVTLKNGEIVAKTLKAKEKRHISVFSIVRLQSGLDLDMRAFRESLSQKSNKVLVGGGEFGRPAVTMDLDALKIDDRDLEDMQTCTVGDCNLKLPAAMIKKLQTEIDWNTPDSKLQATNVFKQFLVDYARDYQVRGDQALVELADKRKPVRLIDEYRTLFDGSIFIRSLAPEFDNYLRKYPGADLPGVENRLDWSKVSSGLKPIITITHGTSFAKNTDYSSLMLITTKQLYASHYVDASLALSAIVRIGGGDSADTYLIFTNISSSDALGGAFSDMAHGVVEGEALAKVQDLLRRAKARIEAKPAVQSEATPVSDRTAPSWIEINLARIVGVGGFVVLILIGAFVFRRLRR